MGALQNLALCALTLVHESDTPPAHAVAQAAAFLGSDASQEQALGILRSKLRGRVVEGMEVYTDLTRVHLSDWTSLHDLGMRLAKAFQLPKYIEPSADAGIESWTRAEARAEECLALAGEAFDQWCAGSRGLVGVAA